MSSDCDHKNKNDTGRNLYRRPEVHFRTLKPVKNPGPELQVVNVRIKRSENKQTKTIRLCGL